MCLRVGEDGATQGLPCCPHLPLLVRTDSVCTHTHTPGITINQYQVDRATHHNARLGVSPLTDVVRGNFMELPFEPASFDAAYAIEATCHGASGCVGGRVVVGAVRAVAL